MGLLNNLSNRAKNVCERNGLQSAEDFIAFLKNGGSISKVRNCGRLTADEILSEIENSLFSKSELVRLRKIRHNFGRQKSWIDFIKLREKQIIDFKEFNKNFYGILIDNFSLNEFVNSKSSKLFELSYQNKKSKLSIRSQNVLNDLTNFKESRNEIESIRFLRTCLMVEFNFSEIRNVGYKSNIELTEFRSEIFHILESITQKKTSEEDLVIINLENAFHFKDSDGLVRKDIENKTLNILSFIDKYILTESNFKPIECDVLRFKISPSVTQKHNKSPGRNSNESRNWLSNKYGLTNERVRQISKNVEIKFSKKVTTLTEIFKYSFNLDELIRDRSYFFIKEQPLSNIKGISILSSSTSFANVLKLFNHEEYYVLTKSQFMHGIIGAFDQNTYKKFRKLKINVLIKNEFIESTVVKSTLKNFYQFLTGKINKDHYVEVSKFIDGDMTKEQKNFLTSLLADNFNLDRRGNELNIKKNIFVKKSELIREILTDIDRPLSMTELSYEFHKRFPKYGKDLRASIQNDKNYFIVLRGAGQAGESKYGLKEWEKTKNFIGGSIKELCISFLENSDEPIHIHHLTKHVIKHRDTNQKNLITNLKLGTKNRFSFFDGGFVGLASRTYSKKILNSYKNNESAVSRRINDFIKKNLYYDELKLIKKFSRLFGIYAVQIEDIIQRRIDEGIFKKQSKTIYYNRIDEESVINFFLEYSCSDHIGHNPYKLDIDNIKVNAWVKIFTSDDIEFNVNEIVFDKNYLTRTDLTLIILYQKIHKKFVVGVLRHHGPDHLRHSLLHNDLNDFDLKDIRCFPKNDDELIILVSENRLNIYSFGLTQLSSFVKEIKVLNNSNLNSSSELNFDITEFKISGLKKMDAYDIIIRTVENKYDKNISLTEAKEIYNRLMSFI